MKSIWSVLICSVAYLLGQTVGATPPNTSASSAVSYEVGQGWVSHYFEEATQSRWFRFTTVGRRSYCIEAAQGSDSHVALDPSLSYYSDAAGISLAASNADGAGEPPMTAGARICFVDSSALNARSQRSVKLSTSITPSSGDNGYIRLRIFDTTLVSAVGVTDPNGALTNNHVALFNLSDSTVAVTITSLCSTDANGTTGLSTTPAVVTTMTPNQIVGFLPSCANGYYGNANAWARMWIAIPSASNKVVAMEKRIDVSTSIKLN